MRPSVWIALVLALAAGSTPLLAAARSEMRGTVFESGKRTSLTGAVAMLYSRADNGAHYLTSSDPQGRFMFHSLSRGTYDLEVTLPGYRTGRKINLQVRPPFRSIVEVLLEPGAEPDTPPAPVDTTAVAANEEILEEENGIALTLQLTGPENEPVPEGLASLVPLSFEGNRRYERSDLQGKVTFTALRPGRYRLVASAPGYLTVRSERIDLTPGGISHVIVILTPYPLDYAGNLEDLLPPEEPLLPRRLEIDLPESTPAEIDLPENDVSEIDQSGRTP